MLKGDCNICINGKMPSYSATCVECGLSRKNYKPITNADRIRAMTDEELADVFDHVQGDAFLVGIGQRENSVYPGAGISWLDWLKKEVDT